MKAYLDGSGDKCSDFLVLTGIAASDSVWAGFEKEWGDLLKNRSPEAPFVHACDMNALQNEFSRENGWDENRVSRLFWDCIMYAQHLDKQDFRVITCTVDMEAYRDIRSRGRLPHPYAICSRFCSELIMKWYLKDFAKNFPKGKLNYFFDRNERHLAAFNIRRKAAAKAVRKPHVNLRTHWDVVDDAIPVDMRDRSPVQLADIISWSHSRRLMQEKCGKESNMRMPWSDFYVAIESVLPLNRIDWDRKRLAVLSLYGGMLPDTLDELFGPDWSRNLSI
jgi:Protein of unknown function (DUF3800)